jgi:hypothetical protein
MVLQGRAVRMKEVAPLGGPPLHDVFLISQLRQYNDYILPNLGMGGEIKLSLHIIDLQRG